MSRRSVCFSLYVGLAGSLLETRFSQFVFFGGLAVWVMGLLWSSSRWGGRFRLLMMLALTLGVAAVAIVFFDWRWVAAVGLTGFTLILTAVAMKTAPVS